jgi:hypothetical protein
VKFEDEEDVRRFAIYTYGAAGRAGIAKMALFDGFGPKPAKFAAFATG